MEGKKHICVSNTMHVHCQSNDSDSLCVIIQYNDITEFNILYKIMSTQKAVIVYECIYFVLTWHSVFY